VKSFGAFPPTAQEDVYKDTTARPHPCWSRERHCGRITRLAR